MLRLLQGDVGSGKTAVAAVAMAIVADAGRQAALLAPTDLLARQHAATLTRLPRAARPSGDPADGSLRPAARREALDRIGAPGQVLDGTQRGPHRGRHARPGRGRRRLRRPGAGHHRRAAPLRRRAARGARGQGIVAARPADDRDAHPTDPGTRPARRPRRDRPARRAGRPAVDRDRHPAQLAAHLADEGRARAGGSARRLPAPAQRDRCRPAGLRRGAARGRGSSLGSSLGPGHGGRPRPRPADGRRDLRHRRRAARRRRPWTDASQAAR